MVRASVQDIYFPCSNMAAFLSLCLPFAKSPCAQEYGQEDGWALQKLQVLLSEEVLLQGRIKMGVSGLFLKAPQPSH